MPTELPPDFDRQKIVAVILAAAILIVVIELVRKRKLREEYTVLWVGTALILLALALWGELLTWFQKTIGAAASTSALFFGGLVFLMLVALQLSVRLSKLTFRNKTLSQRVALLEKQIEDLRADTGGAEARDGDGRIPTTPHRSP